MLAGKKSMYLCPRSFRDNQHFVKRGNGFKFVYADFHFTDSEYLGKFLRYK